jgi:hypothetical protein
MRDLSIGYNIRAMTQGPLEKAITRRRDLLTKNSELRAEIDKNTAEIAQIDAALVVLRKYAPLGQLPGLDEDVSAVYGDLASMTVPDGLATILYKRGEALTTRELLDILVKAGKLKANNNSMIHVIGALKRNEHRFRKVGSGWTLIEPNHQLRVLEGIGNVGAEG